MSGRDGRGCHIRSCDRADVVCRFLDGFGTVGAYLAIPEERHKPECGQVDLAFMFVTKVAECPCQCCRFVLALWGKATESLRAEVMPDNVSGFCCLSAGTGFVHQGDLSVLRDFPWFAVRSAA